MYFIINYSSELLSNQLLQACTVKLYLFIIYIFLTCCTQDLTSVQNLQKKHALLEADVGSHAERIDTIKNQAEQFIENEHFDADNIRAKRVRTL